MSKQKLSGHCYCGAVQFETSGDPIWVSHCHCESCRRHSGSAMTTYAGFRPDQVTFTAEMPSRFSPGNGVTRSFCGQCGSSVAYEAEHSPNEIHLYIGLFDDPGQLEPADHSFYAEKVSWLQVDDQLPKYQNLEDMLANR